MSPMEAKELLATLPQETRIKVARIVQECLYTGQDRPDRSLVGVGYKRYDDREELFLAWDKMADEVLKGT